MPNIIDHSRKVNRAFILSKIGAYPGSRHAMLAALPAPALDVLTAEQLAEMLDALWSLAQQSKAIAIRDALQEGIIWDGARHRGIAA